MISSSPTVAVGPLRWSGNPSQRSTPRQWLLRRCSGDIQLWSRIHPQRQGAPRVWTQLPMESTPSQLWWYGPHWTSKTVNALTVEKDTLETGHLFKRRSQTGGAFTDWATLSAIPLQCSKILLFRAIIDFSSCVMIRIICLREGTSCGVKFGTVDCESSVF